MIFPSMIAIFLRYGPTVLWAYHLAERLIKQIHQTIGANTAAERRTELHTIMTRNAPRNALKTDLDDLVCRLATECHIR